MQHNYFNNPVCIQLEFVAAPSPVVLNKHILCAHVRVMITGASDLEWLQKDLNAALLLSMDDYNYIQKQLAGDSSLDGQRWQHRTIALELQ